MRRYCSSFLALLLLAAAVPPPARAAAGAGTLTVRDCTEGKTKVPARCGSLRVYENRASHSGRTIAISFILLRAAHPNGHVIYVNLGGPASELGDVAAIADGEALEALSALRDRYDILFVDERGFGESHPIGCDLAPPANPGLYFRQLWPDKLLAQCRKRSAQTSDLSQYNTPIAVDDLDDLRAALGYRKMVFDVDSYGTFTALVYMRRHPESVESAVLSGVDPPGLMNLALEFATGAQVSLDRIAVDCERDAGCRKSFPDFLEHFYIVLHRFDAGPIPVRITNSLTKRKQTVLLSREVFTDAIRHALYEPDIAAYVPVVIERAYHNDTAPLGALIEDLTQDFASIVNGGAFLSYTCAEVVPFANSPSDLETAKKTSWFGDDRIAAQQHACAIWNVPALDASFNQPVHGDAPILMISGGADPATPAYEGQEALQYLPNARQILIAGAPHDTESPCVDRTIEAFIRANSWADLDLTACTGTFKSPPFATSWPPH